MEKDGKPTFKDTVLRIIAIIGLIAIILLGAWGIIQLAFNLPTWIGSWSNKTTDTNTTHTSLTVTAPPFTNTGQPLTVAWTHNHPSADRYSYTISYSCTQNLVLRAPTPTGMFQPVPCNTPFNYVTATANMQLVPEITGPSQLSTTLTVAAVSLADGTVITTGSSTITVLPPRNTIATTTTPTVQAPKKSHTATYTKRVVSRNRYSNPNGIADLALHIDAVVPKINGSAAVHFVIENVGTKVTPSGWTFTASLPIGYQYTYYSQPQQRLYPGDKIVYTLTFNNNLSTNPYSNGNTVTITVDPNNLIREVTKANNTTTATLP